jgi:hypothetical protein
MAARVIRIYAALNFLTNFNSILLFPKPSGEGTSIYTGCGKLGSFFLQTAQFKKGS